MQGKENNNVTDNKEIKEKIKSIIDNISSSTLLEYLYGFIKAATEKWGY